MKKALTLVLFLLIALALYGCNDLTADVKDSAKSIKDDFQQTKDFVVDGIEDTKEFVDDVSTAAQKIKEAQEAVANISK